MLHFGFWNFSAFKAAMIKVKDILAMACSCSFWNIETLMYQLDWDMHRIIKT